MSAGGGKIQRTLHGALFALGMRLVVYALLLSGLAIWMLWGAVHYGKVFFDEIGPVEILETGFALLSAVFFLWGARFDSARTTCSVLLAGSLFCVAVRESDYFLDVLVGRHTWKVAVALIVTGMVLYAAAKIKELYPAVIAFINRPCFGLFVSGVLVLVIFSRLFGYGPFWQAILDDSSFHTVKTIVEEGVEQRGYFLILISSVEYLHNARIHSRYTSLK